MSTLRDRGYVRMDKKRLIPEDKGRIVTAFLESFFKRYVEYDFTADLEEQLDKVSAGDIAYKQVLRDFWDKFTASIDDVKDLRVAQVIDALNDLLAPHIFPAKADGGDARACPSCGNGQLSLKLSKYGTFVGCTNYPDCKYTRQMTIPLEGAPEAVPAEGIPLGTDPETGATVTRRIGRFGPYLQLGEATEEGEKPKRASIPKGRDPAAITFEEAMRLLSLPREVGLHPETKTPIIANNGRFGPFILHDGTYANLKDPDDVYTIGLNRAVDLLHEKRSKGPSNRARPGALRDLGAHPDGGGNISVMGGRYGAYLKYGKINATLPKDVTPESLTVDQAVALIAERASKTGAKLKPVKAAKTAKNASKAPAAKKAAKKPAARKAPAKKVAPAA